MTEEERAERRRDTYRRYRVRHAEEVRARERARKETEHVKLADARYRAEHRAENAERTRKWYAAHSERARAYWKRYRAEHADKVRTNQRRYRDQNRDHRREVQREYCAANHEKRAALWRNRRARVAAAPGRHTGADILGLFGSQKGKCAGCGVALVTTGPKKYHVDHVMPLSRGGSNDPGNLQLLCKPCNQAKSDRDPQEWAAELGKLFL